MNPSKNTSKQQGLKKSVITIAAALVLIVVAYFGYTLLASRVNPCESLFEQTTSRVQKKIGSIKTEGKSFLDDAQIQNLSSQSQQAALGLKTCCIFFHEEKIAFDEFLKCQDDFKNFETVVARVPDLIAEIQKATQEKKTGLANFKLKRIHQTLNGLEKLSKTLQEQIHLYTQRSPDMKAKKSSLSQPSILTEAEPNDAYHQATKISMGKITGELAEDDQNDYFKFDVPSGGILNVDFRPDETGESMKISLRNIERHEIWNPDTVVPGVTKSTRVVMNTTSGGTFFVVVSNGSGPYTFTLANSIQNDGGSGNDAGDKITTAIEIQPGRDYLGELGGFDAEDWYQFDIAAGHILNLAFTPDPEAEGMAFSLRNSERTEIWYSNIVTPGVTKAKRVMMNTLSGGRYYLAAFDGQGLYTFEIHTESQNDADCGTDAGDKITEAIEIKPELSYKGELGGLDEEDWYKFEIPDGHVLEFAITLAPESNPLKFSLLNDARKEVWRSGELAPGVTESDRLLMNTTSGGTYFLKSFYGDGIYRIDFYTKSQNDAETGTDAGDRITKALKIKSGRSFVGELGGLDEEDWYTFEPQKGEKLNFTCNPEGEPMKLALRALEQREGGYSAEIFPGVTKSLEIPEDIKPPYFIRISDGRGKYSIELN